jgi:hypothetical protein
MLSKLLQPLRNIISVASHPNPKIEPSSTKSSMVTTRQQSFNKVQNEVADNSSVDEIPAELLSPNPRKRRRAQSAKGGKNQGRTSPSPSAKRQKLPVRNKDEALVRHPHISVVIPVRDIKELQAATSTPSSQRMEKAKQPPGQEPDAAVEDEDHQVVTKELAVVSDDGLLNPAHGGGADAITIEDSEREWKKDTESKVDREPIMEGTRDDASASLSKTRHKWFDSEEPTNEEIAEDVRNIEDANESSDDDAPEVVATHDAEESIKNAAREISKAAEQ